MKTWISGFCVSTVLVVATMANAQRAPRACTATNPAVLTPTTMYSPVSSVMTNAPLTLWTLYASGDSTGQSTVMLGKLEGVESNALHTTFFTLGAGNLAPGALAVMGSNLVAVYQRPDLKIEVVMHPIAGGTDVHTTLEAAQPAVGLSVSVVRGRALVGWDDNATGLRYAWVSNTGQVSGATSLTGAYGAPVTTSAFGGALIAQDIRSGRARVGVLPATARPRMTAAPAGANVIPATGLSVTNVGNGVMVMSGAMGRAHLTLLRNAAGAGTDRDLGTTTVPGETGIAGTPWGAFLAWIDTGLVTFLPVTANGRDVGGSFPLSSTNGGEVARSPSVAASGNVALVTWFSRSASGLAVKFVRVSCL